MSEHFLELLELLEFEESQEDRQNKKIVIVVRINDFIINIFELVILCVLF